MLEAYKAGGVGNFPGASGAFFVVVRKTWCRPFFLWPLIRFLLAARRGSEKGWLLE